MNIFLIILGIILLIISTYTTYNLLKKNEKLEEAIDKQDQYITSLSEKIEYSLQQLKVIDEKGSFEADDEIGWFFQNIKSIQSILNQYILENGENKENKKEKRT